MTTLTTDLIASPLGEARPGDVLLFSRQESWYGRAIAIKTWSRFTHVEVAVVRDRLGVFTYTSRNGEGVNLYAPELGGLALVLRPAVPFDQARALTWSRSTIGQGYDYVGLLAFFLARYQGRENGRMFCSEACTRYLRAGGADLFPAADADTIAPRDFSINPYLRVVWRSADEWARYHQKTGRLEEVA